MANGAGIEIPKVDFTTLDPDKIEIGSYFIGFDQGNSGKLSKMDHLGNITLIEGAVTSQFRYEIGEWVPSEGGVIAHRWLTNDTVENYLVIDTEDIVLPGCDTILVNYYTVASNEEEPDDYGSVVVSTDGTGMMGKNTYTWEYRKETFVIQWTGAYWALMCTTNYFDYEDALAVLNTSSNCPYGTYTIRNVDPSPILNGFSFDSFSITQCPYIEWISANEGLIGVTSKTGGLTNTSNLTDAAIEGGFDMPAARLCKDRISNGKSDWYLPAIYELHSVNINYLEISKGLTEAGGSELSDFFITGQDIPGRGGIGDIPSRQGKGDSGYWSSTEIDADFVRAYSFAYGGQGVLTKGKEGDNFTPSQARVRAMRIFSI
jgi:hypothetical protein